MPDHPEVEKETLGAALLDAARQMVRGSPRQTESERAVSGDRDSWAEATTPDGEGGAEKVRGNIRVA